MQGLLDEKPDLTSLPAAKHFSADAARTAAGVLHFAMDENGIPVVLLGRRDDDKTYCNLGGKSDAAETLAMEASYANTFLSQTASREVQEESNGYYAHHPSELERLPFIDLLSNRPDKGSLLYRMYVKKVKKVYSEILLKAAEKAKNGHNQEYDHFIWVPAKKIMEAVFRKTDQISVEGAEPLQLYSPLFKMLSTPSGMAFLGAIYKKGRLSVKDAALRKSFNRLYVEKREDDNPFNNNNNSSTSIANGTYWNIPKVEGLKPETFTTTLQTINQEGQKHTVRSYVVPTVPFGQNAWGQTSQTVRYGGYDQDISVDSSAQRDHKIFCDAVAAHGAAMVEMKHKILAKTGEDAAPVAGKDWDPNCPLSISRIHLRMVLGIGFKEAKDFADQDNPQRAADIDNLRNYLSVHNEVEYAQKKAAAELKRKISFTNHDLEIFADILQWEENRRFSPVFYHAATAELNNLWHSFTHVRELIRMEPFVGRNVVLRGTDIYFRDLQSMPDILNTMGTDDYANGKASVVLCANFLLTAGISTSRTTSSSLEYFLNDHSVDAPDTRAKFDEAMALAGITADYIYFKSAFLQYMAHQDPTFENSVMLGISFPESLLQDNSSTDSHRSEYPRGAEVEDKKVLHVSASPIFHGIQQEYLAHKDQPESFDVDKERKRDLIPEARLSLHPSFIQSPAVRIQAFNRFPISPSEQRQFNDEVRNASIGTMSQWLQSQQQITPNSFVDYPVLKRLHKMAFTAQTGEQPQEKPAIESLKHLFANGHVDGIRHFLELFPDVLPQMELDYKKMAQMTMRNDNVEMLRFICEEHPTKSVMEFYQDRLDFIKAIITCLLLELDKCLEYLLSQYDLSRIHDETVENLTLNIDSNTKKTAAVFARAFPAMESKLMKKIFGKKIFISDLDVFIEKGYKPEELFSKIIKLRGEDTLEYGAGLTPFEMLMVKKADLSTINPITKQAYVFELADFDMAHTNELMNEFSKQLPKLATCRDIEGRDIFMVAKEAKDKGRRNLLLRLMAGLVIRTKPFMDAPEWDKSEESRKTHLNNHISESTRPQNIGSEESTEKIRAAMAKDDFKSILLDFRDAPCTAGIYSSPEYETFKKSLKYLYEKDLDSCNKYDKSDLEIIWSIFNSQWYLTPDGFFKIFNTQIKDPRVLRYVLMDILRLENEADITRLLNKAFPDIDEFIALKKTCITVYPIQDNTMDTNEIKYFDEKSWEL